MNPEQTVTVECECGARFTGALWDASLRYTEHVERCPARDVLDLTDAGDAAPVGERSAP